MLQTKQQQQTHTYTQTSAIFISAPIKMEICVLSLWTCSRRDTLETSSQFVHSLSPGLNCPSPHFFPFFSSFVPHLTLSVPPVYLMLMSSRWCSHHAKYHCVLLPDQLPCVSHTLSLFFYIITRRETWSWCCLQKMSNVDCTQPKLFHLCQLNSILVWSHKHCALKR